MIEAVVVFWLFIGLGGEFTTDNPYVATFPSEEECRVSMAEVDARELSPAEFVYGCVKVELKRRTL